MFHFEELISFGTGSLQAKELLERVAKQVQPVMRKHSWSVPLLSELYSRNSRVWVRRILLHTSCKYALNFNSHAFHVCSARVNNAVFDREASFCFMHDV